MINYYLLILLPFDSDSGDPGSGLTFEYISSGGIVIGGASDSFPVFGTDGGIFLGGIFSFSDIVYINKKSQTFSWSIASLVRKELIVSWNNNVPSNDISFKNWYRVEGACLPPAENNNPYCALGINCDGSTSWVMNVLALNTQDVCRQLAARHWLYPVQSVQKFNFPPIGTPTEACNNLIDVTDEFFLDCTDLEGISYKTDVIADFTVGEYGSFAYIPSGSINISGNTGSEIINLAFQFDSSGAGFNPPTFAGIVIRSHADVTVYYNYVTSGEGIVLGGSADTFCSNYSYIPTGGIFIVGSTPFIWSDWHYIPTGGINLSGNTFPGVICNGGITISGASPINYEYLPTTGIVIGGSASWLSSQFQYTANGGIVISGSSSADSTDMGTLTTDVSAGFALEIEGGLFDSISAPAINTTIINRIKTLCCNQGLSSQLYLTHNLSSANLLSFFLSRNKFILPNPISFQYNPSCNCWQANYHRQGLSAITPYQESWDILFKFDCVSGIQLNNNTYWKFLLQVSSKQYDLSNVVTSKSLTKIIGFFNSTAVCPKLTAFNFSFKLNTTTKTSTPSIIAPVVLEDGINLFGGVWKTNPLLKIGIADASVATLDNHTIFPDNVGDGGVLIPFSQ